MKKSVFREIIETKSKKITSQKGKAITLYSHNKGLFKGWKHNIYGKTGYTRAARACFVGYYNKGNKPFIVAVFGCSQRWDDVKYIVERYAGLDL
jgi:D-alanyl-D-alanine carboxypeptidase